MDVLRNLFGNLSAGIIRLLVTVGILAAVYFFVVRPALDTAEKVGHETNVSIQKSIHEAHFGDISKSIHDVNRQVQREIKKSLRHAPSHSAADKLLRCVQRAHQNVHRIERCNERYQP
jgi:Tfp pilus assembly protein PilO